jgi:hypothetical protein
LLLLSQSKQRLLTTSSNTTFAGRSFCIAPQNPLGLIAQPARSTVNFSNIDTFAPKRACAARSYARMTGRKDHGFRTKVTPC